MAKKEIDRVVVRLPDISGNVYEKDDHYWQDVTERYDVTITYEDKKVRPKQYNVPLAYEYANYPPPYQQQYRQWAKKWNLLVSRKEWKENRIDEETKTIDLGPVVTAPIISPQYPQFWYGTVNYWTAKGGSTYYFEQSMPYLVDCKCTGFHIEMVEWAGTGPTNSTMAEIERAYAKLCEVCRQNKMWIFVDIVNGNFNGSRTSWRAGFPGYANHTTGTIINQYGQRLIDIIKSQGPQNVIVEPVGEAGGKGYRNEAAMFQDMCVDQLGDRFTLVTELNAPVVSQKIRHAMKYNVKHAINQLHALDENERLIKDVNDGEGPWKDCDGADIIVSDSGPAIQALASPDDRGHLNTWTSAESRASRFIPYISACKSGGASVIVYYAFKYMGVDGELKKGSWNNTVTPFINPKYPNT